MAQLQSVFNAQAIDPSQGSAQLPVGDYPVVIKSSEIKGTSKNDGSGMAVFDCEIIDGPHKGAGGVFRLNLYSTNDQARQIAERQMSAICHATGVFMVQDTAQLHNLPFGLSVGLQRDPEAAAKGFTEVKKFLNADGSPITPGGHAQPPAAAPAAAPTQAPAAAAAWGGGQAAAAPTAAPAAAGWQQGGAPAAAKPAWGK